MGARVTYLSVEAMLEPTELAGLLGRPVDSVARTDQGGVRRRRGDAGGGPQDRRLVTGLACDLRSGTAATWSRTRREAG